MFIKCEFITLFKYRIENDLIEGKISEQQKEYLLHELNSKECNEYKYGLYISYLILKTL